jgi:predicted DNA-binding mobile mystery protein A
MSHSLGTVQRRQVEVSLAPWTAISPHDRPSGGWVRTIRQALGMSAAQLGRRLGLSRQAAADLERREVSLTVTLATLQKAAAAMNADLVYAIVPRQGLEATIRSQARMKAEQTLGRAAHTMKLEAQGVSDDEYNAQLDDAEEQIMKERPRDLWDGEDSPATPK